MRQLARLCGVCLMAAVAVPILARSQEARPPATLEPTVLERFAARPDARVIWERALGPFESTESTAAPTALVVESPSATPSTMRGLRFEFASRRPRSCNFKYVEWSEMCARERPVAYVEESRLESVRNGILQGRAEIHPGHPHGATWYRTGIPFGSVWGVLFCGFGFPYRELSELADVFTRAIAELRSAPR